ncbi:MAG: hypothetical protein HRU51_10050, partial [Xanthomonadales bacterium]|nr:hypothetical protein [Xanthomonadales bacterium]
NDAQPRSLPKIANATFIGRPDTTGATLRRGTGANITNAIFSGFGKCLDIDSDATFAAAGSPDALSGTLTIQNSIVNCATNFDEEDGDAWSVAAWFNAAGSNQELDPALENVLFPPANADYLQGAELDRVRFGAFFQNLGHIGAFGEGHVWTAGCTLQNFNR